MSKRKTFIFGVILGLIIAPIYMALWEELVESLSKEKDAGVAQADSGFGELIASYDGRCGICGKRVMTQIFEKRISMHQYCDCNITETVEEPNKL